MQLSEMTFPWILILFCCSSFVSCSGLKQESYQLNINESGTSFNETVEIDDVEKTVVYKVPSHNEIKKTDVMVDYKNGHFVTKIPEREVCYIKAFPIADVQSIGETKQNLKLMQRIRTRSGNVSVPVETVTTIMKVIREIPREELSPKVLDFCGNNSAYLVEEKVMPVSKDIGKSNTKRSGGPVTKLYRLAVHSSVNGIEKTLPNGYLTCKNVKDHNKALFNCLRRKKTPLVGCGLHPITCRYQATCSVLPIGEKKVPSDGSIDLRDDLKDTTPGFIFVDIKCVEQHMFTVQWCCDVIPCPK